MTTALGVHSVLLSVRLSVRQCSEVVILALYKLDYYSELRVRNSPSMSQYCLIVRRISLTVITSAKQDM